MRNLWLLTCKSLVSVPVRDNLKEFFLSVTNALVTYEFKLLGALLMTVITAWWWGIHSAGGKCMMLAHWALFVLWQPRWHVYIKTPSVQCGCMALLTLSLYYLNPGIMALWVLVLLSSMGAKLVSSPQQRMLYLMSMALLYLLLWLGIIPSFSIEHAQFHLTGFYPGLLILCLVVFFAKQADSSSAIDFMHGVLFILFNTLVTMVYLLVLAYTSFALLPALIVSLLTMAALLFLLAYLWQPKGQFLGLRQIWHRYLLNVGTPVETWISKLTLLAQAKRIEPHTFMQYSVQELVQLEWIAGVHWQSLAYSTTPGKEEETILKTQLKAGQSTLYDQKYAWEEEHLTLYFHSAVGATLDIHSQLLVKLIELLHQAKVREVSLAQQSHIKAVHEVGAKLTHDVKNILQGLHSLITIVNQRTQDTNASTLDLLARQLPIFCTRLQVTLDKLKVPSQTSQAMQNLNDWWQALRNRYEGRHIEFVLLGSDVALSQMPNIPGDMFDSVVENLLENARHKRVADPHVSIKVTLVYEHNKARASNKLALHVQDSGQAVSPQVLATLFKAPISSKEGFGIGLLQALRQAKQFGYDLNITDNTDGCVVFTLQANPSL